MIILGQFWLLYDKIQPFAEKGAQFQLLIMNSDGVAIFWKKLPRTPKTSNFGVGAQGYFFIIARGAKRVKVDLDFE